jgi:hypothetical protein
MTKTNTKPTAAAQQSTASRTLIALGFDEHQKPRGARTAARNCSKSSERTTVKSVAEPMACSLARVGDVSTTLVA